MDVQDDVREIARMRRSIEAAENAGDATAVLDMLADDAVIMAPNQPVQEGRAACAAFLADVIPGQVGKDQPARSVHAGRASCSHRDR
jgi:uncharacterized protein (TIGR02246 family)